MSDWNFARVWSSIAAEAPDRIAVVSGPVSRTFGELAARAEGLAGTLARAGVGAGDKVAIDLLNRPEYLETFYAALLLGAVPVNVNYRYGVEETRYLLDDADAAAIVTEARFAPVVTEAVARSAAPPMVVELGPAYEAAVAGAPVADRTRAVGRRPDLPLHRRHHRHAQGRDVAHRRSLRGVVADGPPRHRATRPSRRGPRRQAGRDHPARLSADARHRPVRHAVGVVGRRHGGADRRDGTRPGADLGRGGRACGRGAHDRRRRVRPTAARRARGRAAALVARVAAAPSRRAASPGAPRSSAACSTTCPTSRSSTRSERPRV